MAEYIEREKTIEALCRCCLANGNCGHTCKEITALQSIPATDVRPVVKAHFNLVDGYSITALGYDIKGLECSNCGATFIAQTWVKKFKYCPNCGAALGRGSL
jgi:hypothetical protein